MEKDRRMKAISGRLERRKREVKLAERKNVQKKVSELCSRT